MPTYASKAPRTTATGAAMGVDYNLSYQALLRNMLDSLRVAEMDRRGQIGYYDPADLRGIKPKKLFYDEFTLKPERNQEMACEVCGKTPPEAKTATITSGNKHVVVNFDVDHESTRVRKCFYTCEECYPKIKAKIAEISHAILALGECKHTD